MKCPNSFIFNRYFLVNGLWSIDFDHFDILASDVSKFRFLIKESLLIKLDQTQNHEVISIKTIWLKHFLIDFHCS